MNMLCLSQDEGLNEQLRVEAQRLNWKATIVSDRSLASKAVRELSPDILLVEIRNVADLDWWLIASIAPGRPVIFLNDEMSEEFMTKALDSGADAFIPKQLFSPRHFESRVNSLLRRSGWVPNRRRYEAMNMVIDSEKCLVEVAGQGLDLTLTEFKILRELAAADSHVVARDDIHDRVFGSTKVANRALDVHVCALRKKVKAYHLEIVSIRGVGYRLIGGAKGP